MSNVDVLNNVEVNAHTRLIQIRTHTNNRSIFFSILSSIEHNSIFDDYYCYSAGSEEQQIQAERNLEGIEEKWHIFCHSSFFCVPLNTSSHTSHTHQSKTNTLYTLQ